MRSNSGYYTEATKLGDFDSLVKKLLQISVSTCQKSKRSRRTNRQDNDQIQPFIEATVQLMIDRRDMTEITLAWMR